jgi:hypothetical protein
MIRSYFQELITTTRDGWNHFWFTPADPATLGILRIMTGLMLLYTHAVWGLELNAFFGPGGHLTAEFARGMHDNSPWAWSYLYAIQSPSMLRAVHLLAFVPLAMFTVGLFTRPASVMAYLVTVSYAHRAVGALYGLDQINAFLTLYLAISPSGDAYSLDNWRGSARQGRGVEKSTMANIGQRLIQVHMCVVYLFAGLGKLLGSSWWAGMALWGAFANFEYQTLDMTWVSHYPLLVNAMTQVILVWEIGYIVLVWPRLTRPLVLALAIPLHLGIAICMGMTTFGLIMLVGNFSFVPPGATKRFVASMTGLLRGSMTSRHPSRTMASGSERPMRAQRL